MKTLTIPNIPEYLIEKMESRAVANGRSVEDEALVWLQTAKSWSALPGVPVVMGKRTPEEEAELDRQTASPPRKPAEDKHERRRDKPLQAGRQSLIVVDANVVVYLK